MNKKSNKKPTVTIIMSTFNGEKYISEQLNSIAKQKNVKVKLFIRDDGSYDDTIKIANKYKNKFEEFVVLKGKNIGATKSFYEASENVLREEYLNSDYFAFCDQDDIWEERKLEVAISKLVKMNQKKPNLYYSNLLMIDKNEKEIQLLINDSLVSRNKKNALSSINAYGCTCVFNRIALVKFCMNKDKRFLYHDNWLYSVCSYLGSTYYDPSSYIRYRQTGENVSGEKKFGIFLWMQRIKKIANLNSDKKIYENIAKELIYLFKNELEYEDIVFLKRVSNYRNSIQDKLYLILSNKTKTNNLSKNICIIGRIILNSY